MKAQEVLKKTIDISTGDFEYGDAAVDLGFFAEYELRDVSLNQIKSHFGAKYSPANELKPDEDEKYAVEYSTYTTKAPPIILHPVTNTGYNLIDGRHRMRAAYLRGDKTIQAWVGTVEASPEQMLEYFKILPSGNGYAKSLVKELELSA